MRGRAYDPEVKAAVLAAFLAGSRVAEVVAEFQLPESTAREWQRQAKAGRELVQTQKKGELGDLIADYLRELLTTLAAQARAYRDPDWLAKQDASSAAVLHGVLADKGLRILGALEPLDSASDAAET